jgi:hypothetical protein
MMTADGEGEGQQLMSECIGIFKFNLVMCLGALYVLVTCLGCRGGRVQQPSPPENHDSSPAGGPFATKAF